MISMLLLRTKWDIQRIDLFFGPRNKLTSGVIHKLRNAKFGVFEPPPPLTCPLHNAFADPFNIDCNKMVDPPPLPPSSIVLLTIKIDFLHENGFLNFRLYKGCKKMFLKDSQIRI